MNKLIILLLAVCLVSVHGFVKRETPAGQQPNAFESIQKFGEDIGNKIKEVFDPEVIKKGWDTIIDTSNKAIDSITKSDAPK